MHTAQSVEDQLRHQLEEALTAKVALEQQLADAQETIFGLERDLAWCGELSVLTSLANERDTQRAAEMRQQAEYSDLMLADMTARADALEKDLATAGMLAAETFHWTRR